MDKLKDIYQKIRCELDEQVGKGEAAARSNTEAEWDAFANLDGEAAAPDRDENILGVRSRSSTSVSGLVSSKHRWTVEYDTLRKAINDKVKGITVNKREAEQIFHVVRDMIEHPKKYEHYERGEE